MIRRVSLIPTESHDIRLYHLGARLRRQSPGDRCGTGAISRALVELLKLEVLGIDLQARAGSLTADSAEALRNEARRRASAGEFLGHISFVSVIARKPGAGNG